MSKRQVSTRDPLTSVAQEPIEMLAHRPSRAKRDRSWEKTHPLVAYRGVPRELNDQIVAIAQHNRVPTGEVARLFLEAGLKLHLSGQLNLTPMPVEGRCTLFPGE